MAIDFNAPIQSKKGLKPVPRQPYSVLDLEAAKKKFQPYIEKIEEVTKDAQALQVDTDETNQKAVEIGTSAKKLLKQIDEARTQAITEPYNYVKSVNGFAKMFSDKLSNIENMMKSKITQYRAYQEQKRREAEAVARKATEEAQKKLNEDAKSKGIEPVQLDMPVVPKQNGVTRSETGSAYGNKHWTFKVIEPGFVRQLIDDLNYQGVEEKLTQTIIKLKALVPYLVLSDTKIRDAIKGGIRQIPGIEIFEEDRTSFRT